MLVEGPQRRLFFACVIVGFASLLSLDLHFAPASLAAGETADAAAVPDPLPRPAGQAPDGASEIAARLIIPAPARVPTIVARFETAAREPIDQSAIRALATAMIEEHDVSIVLEGHSDTRGGDDYNHKISLERAEWVKARVVELGVSPDRIETVGLGATRPLRSDDPDAPSVNRRVEVRWLGSAAREAPPPARAPARTAAASAATAPVKEPRPPTTELADAGAPLAPVTPVSTAGAVAPASTATPDASVRLDGPSPSEQSPHTPPGNTRPTPGDD